MSNANVSNANVALVESLYAAFKRGDIPTIIAALAPDVTWEVTGRPEDYPILGRRKGPAAVQEFFRLIGELQEASEFSPREFHAAGEKVFVLGRYTWKIRKTGRSVSSDWLHVFTIKDGKAAGFQEFTDTAQFAAAYR
jgi:ketosteroid isomerase-like protein